MLWNTFEDNKAKLAEQYKIDCWNQESGLDLENLRKACFRILEEHAQESRQIQIAEVISYILRNAQIEVNPLEWFADKINHGGIVVEIRTMWKEEVDSNEMKNCLEKNKSAQEQMVYTGDADFSHTSPDWNAIMKLGIAGLLGRVRTEKNKKGSAGELNEEQRDFYASCEIVYTAVIEFLKRMAAEARRLSTISEKMEYVAESLENLSVSAPKNIHEAMQLTFIFYYLQTYLEGENVRSLGGLDDLYYEFYKNDLECGKYSKEQIKELIKYCFYKYYALEANSNTPFYLAGMDKEGNGILNELSYLLLETYGELNIHDPKLHIRCYEGISDDFLKKALELIRNGNNSIVFMNDPVVIEGLMKLGQKEEEARCYVPVGCYEPASMGKEVPCSCNGRINASKAVELAVNHGEDLLTGEKYWECEENSTSFEEFYAAVKDNLVNAIERTIEIINGYERHYEKIVHSPLFSATMSEAVERGKDVYHGGAKYNNSSINVIGIADAVDSIIAVKKAVFEEKAVSLAEFADILKHNWKDHTELQRRCKNVYPKYGNNLEEADSIMVDLTDFISERINHRENGRGGKYRCGFFSIDWYIPFGEKTGASPNGRMAGEPLSKNMCAVVGQDKQGVTNLIHTVTKTDYTKIPNGTVLDLMLHTSAVQGKEGIDAMLGILKVYLKRRGIALQMNVLNPQILKKAQRNPEHYATLQIRLCGWNVYFVNLSRQEQDEFIRRAEHMEGNL